MNKKRVVAYFDGSNFYHTLVNNYGMANIKFDHITNNLIDLSKETLVKIKYFNCPRNQQDNPEGYKQQLKFFDYLRKTPLLELFLGKLVRRHLKEINIKCDKCNHQKAIHLLCPSCQDKMEIAKCTKDLEKGVDVQLATHMLIDAINDKYDVALIFSNDADFCPAIKYIVKELKKEVIYCHFPSPKTSELIQTCSGKILITKEIVKKSLY